MIAKHGRQTTLASSKKCKLLNGELSNLLSGDELLRMEKLAIRACTDLIHDRRLQIHLPLTDIECVVDALTPRMTCVDAAGLTPETQTF